MRKGLSRRLWPSAPVASNRMTHYRRSPLAKDPVREVLK
jgi:hypothetical protein